MSKWLLALAGLWILVLSPLEGQAQTVGNCAPSTTSDTLDVADVRAALYNNGGLFWQGSGNVYTVPKDGQATSIFLTSLWFGGLVPDGSHRFVGSTYGPWDLWPGPLDASGNPPDDCADYDRMYSVYDADIRTYEAEGTLTDDLRNWPYHLGAPVVDGDGIEGNYNLAGGDRPHIYGEQSVWWVMNDVGNTKPWSQTPPIGLEVQVQAFAAQCGLLDGYRYPEVDEALSQTTYYHVTLIHKGQEALHDAYVGWYTDADLGYSSNDFIGTDTTRQMAYYYSGWWNEDSFEPGPWGYGHQQPALGYLLARGVDVDHDERDNNRNGQIDEADERLPVTNTLWTTAAFGISPAISTIQVYWAMQSRFRDGTPLTLGRSGYGGDTLTTFMFPGDPLDDAYWSERNLWGNVFESLSGDRHDFVLSSGPFDFAPGDTTSFVLAIPWAQGEDAKGSLIKLRGRATIISDLLDQVMAYDAYSCTLPPEPEAPNPDALGYYVLRQNYPEPFNQQTTIRYEVINTVPVQLHVYDLLGRRIRTLVDGVQDAGVYDVVFEAGDLPAGTYFYRLEAAGYVSITRRMVLQR
ncbi:MAG: hypothetical protein RhofKO_12970 [Rhodothermales bacterium]